MSPEVLQTQRLTFASDLWALGLVTFQMLGGRLPDWPSSSDSCTHTQQDRDTVAVLASEHRPDEVLAKVVSFATVRPIFPFGFAESARDLVNELLQVEPSKRLGLNNPQSLRDHDFFENLNFEALSDVRTTPLAKSLASRGGSTLTSKSSSWSRRRNSIMWTPMPTKYEFNSETSRDSMISESDAEIGKYWNGGGHADVYSLRHGKDFSETKSLRGGSRRRRHASKRPNFAPKGCRGFVDYAG